MRQDDEPDEDGAEEAAHAAGRLPPLPGDQQGGEEGERRELDAGRDPGGHALPPAVLAVLGVVGLGQVPHDRGHQDQVDLAEVDGPHHRLEPERRRRRQQGQAEPDPPVAVAEAVEGEPERGRERDHVHDDRYRVQRLQRDKRDQRERDRGERRVGELQRQLAGPAPHVERVVVVRVVVRRHVPDDQPAVPVDLEVHLLEGAVLAAEGRVDHPADDDEEKGDSTGPEKPCAGQGGGGLKVAFTFALWCAINRIHRGKEIGSGTRPRRASPTLGHTGNHANADRGADRAGAGMSAAGLVGSGPLLLAIPVAAAAGAVTFLSPGCLPLVPGYLAYITGMSGPDASADGAAVATADSGADLSAAGSGGGVTTPPRTGGAAAG